MKKYVREGCYTVFFFIFITGITVNGIQNKEHGDDNKNAT